MRYLISARVKPERRFDLLRQLEGGKFGAGFPFGDLGDTLRAGRVDRLGIIRWVEVCYCREYYGVAMDEELPYFEEFLTEITVADARSPRGCTGYPDCGDCDCTRKVVPKGEPFEEYLRRIVIEPPSPALGTGRPTRWLGWRGELVPGEVTRNEAAAKSAPRDDEPTSI